MPEEKPAPLPLTGEEVQEAVLFKIQESFNRTCHLKYDNAYTSFKAEIVIRLTLSDYGRQVSDNHIVHAEGGPSAADLDAMAEEDRVRLMTTRTVESLMTIEPMPPNQVRVETDQPVPVPVVEGGKRRIKYQKYASRKPVSPKLDK